MASSRRSEAIWIESKAYWEIKVQKNGHRKSFRSSIKGRKGKHEAEGKADVWLASGTEDMRFDKAYELFLADQAEHTGTANHRKHEYIGKLYLLPTLANIRLSRITPNMWRKCIDAGVKADLSQRSLKNIKLSISAFINFARRERWTIERLERGDIVIPSSARAAHREILQPDGLRILFSEDTIVHWGKNQKSFFIHAWRFMVLTGLRRGELCALRNEDIVENVLTVNRSINEQNEITPGKNRNAHRTIVLSKRALSALGQQREMLKSAGIISPWVFPDERGELMTGIRLYSMWTTYRDQHGLKCSLHELRHTFVSIVQNNMPMPMLKAMVGHSEDMDTSAVYGHEVTGEMQRAAAIVDDVFDTIISG